MLDLFLICEAKRREESSSKTLTFAEMMKVLNITPEEIESAEDIDFELE
jgi:hypothetical protein